MVLIPKSITKKLKPGNPYPYLKLFHPVGAATWLISELDPENPDLAFGLCDLGLGFPELGWVSLTELTSTRILGLTVERDRFWTPTMTLAEYAAIAQELGRINA